MRKGIGRHGATVDVLNKKRQYPDVYINDSWQAARQAVGKTNVKYTTNTRSTR